MPDYDLDALADRLGGELITPAHPGYDQARRIFWGSIDRHPIAIARVADATDVAAVLDFTANTGLDVSVRSGGHNTAGTAVIDDGIVIDVRGLDTLDIDVDARTAWAGSGLTAGEVTSALGEHGLAVNFGDTGSVGIGGITLGGGIGFLSRRYGLTIDSLLAVEVVTASGETVVADWENHPDLFWALRGGGGNFGVATRFRYGLQQVDRIIGGMLILPATHDTAAAFLDLAQSAPAELTTIASVMSCPPLPFLPDEVVGQTVLLGQFAWCGDLAEGRAVIDRFRALAEPLADFVKEMAYPEMYGPAGDEQGPPVVARTGFTDVMDAEAIATIMDAIAASDAPIRAIEIRPLGGAIAQVDVDATAFAHRDRAWMINVASFYEDAESLPRRRAWVDELFSSLTGGDQAGYVGFLADEGEQRVRAAYPGRTWNRLRDVKAKYDPDNRFRHNQNVPPA